jgi:hypothetical protein
MKTLKSKEISSAYMERNGENKVHAFLLLWEQMMILFMECAGKKSIPSS